MANSDAKVRLDLNNPVFQDNLLTLQKTERLAALDTLHKIRQLTWNQLYRDQGLKWEKITSIRPPQGIDAIYLSVIGVMEPPVIVNIEPVMIEFMEPFCDRNYRASW